MPLTCDSLCLQTVEATGKRFLVAVDVSSSLSSVTHGSSISTVAVAAAMCMVRLHHCKLCDVCKEL